MMRFTTILVPVDFSMNTEVAILKALELCDRSNVTIHLCHVLRMGANGGYLGSLNRLFTGISQKQIVEVNQKLDEWKSYIAKARPSVTTTCWVCYDSSVGRAIMKKAKSTSADLIIIAKNSQHSWFSFLNTVAP
jgi:nucleotide-binding universal stress UspA family protein